MEDRRNTITIENATIIYRNFAGKETQFNAAGNRNFTVVLDEENARRFMADGWNVKVKDPREDGDDPQYQLPVTVRFQPRPPRIMVRTESTRDTWGEEMVAELDYADIAQCDLVLTPYAWQVGTNSGIKAYLKTMVVTLDEDDLERKYEMNGPANQ